MSVHTYLEWAEHLSGPQANLRMDGDNGFHAKH